MSPSLGFGVIGARSMVARLAVLPALDDSTGSHLAAVCALGGPVDPRWSALAVDSYEAVIHHPDVEAVYIPLPNGMHFDWVATAARAGRHVLCEKPVAPDADTAAAMADLRDETGVVIAEAWMTPFDARWQELLRLARAGLIGTVERIEASFTFTIGPEAADNYRWDPTQGGGALLDVGIYCLGPVVELFGAEPDDVVVTERIERGGVDVATAATLHWADGRHATIRCSFVDAEAQRLELIGGAGRLVLDGDAHTGGEQASRINHVTGAAVHVVEVTPCDPYRAMIDRFASTVRSGAEWPRPLERSVEMLRLLDRIRETPS